MARHTFACAARRCLLDGIPGLRLPGSAVSPPLQSLEGQSQAWGRCCHFCTGREGLAPSWNTELQSLALCGLSEDSVLFRPTGHTGRKVTQHGQRALSMLIILLP